MSFPYIQKYLETKTDSNDGIYPVCGAFWNLPNYKWPGHRQKTP